MAALDVLALDEATARIRAPASGDTYAMPRSLAVTGETLTGSSATSTLALTQTWNTTGAPDLISATVTNTASNTASRLLNLTAGTAHIRFTPHTGTLSLRDSQFSGSNAQIDGGGTDLVFSRNGTVTLRLRNTGAIFNRDLPIALGDVSTASFDVALHRDAANTLAQRNGTNAQTKRIYGTFTDASNGRWLSISMTTAGVASITPTGNGTGASGNVLHISGLPTSNPGPGILWNNAGTPAIGT